MSQGEIMSVLKKYSRIALSVSFLARELERNRCIITNGLNKMKKYDEVVRIPVMIVDSDGKKKRLVLWALKESLPKIINGYGV